MKLDRKRLVLGSAILVAAAAGHLVQNPDLLGGKAGKDFPVLASSANPGQGIVLTQLTQLSATKDVVEVVERAFLNLTSLPASPQSPVLNQPDSTGISDRLETHAGSDAPITVPGTNLSPFGLECMTELALKAAEAGMVNVSLQATCRPDERVEILHDDLIFTAQTSVTGDLQVDIPALSGAATVLVRFADGSVERGTVAIPDASDYERVVLQWQGQTGAQLHAYEFGAGFADDGHVHAQNPRSPEGTHNGTGGFMVMLGDATDAPMAAQVYSYPRGQSANSDVVRVSVEFPVTAANCGRELAANTIQSSAEGWMQSTDLTLTMPNCDAIGEFLVLKNAVRDLKLASN